MGWGWGCRFVGRSSKLILAAFGCRPAFITDRSCTSFCRPASSVPNDQGVVRGAACRPQKIDPHPILDVVCGSTRRQPTRSRGESALDSEPTIGSALVMLAPHRWLAG